MPSGVNYNLSDKKPNLCWVRKHFRDLASGFWNFEDLECLFTNFRQMLKAYLISSLHFRSRPSCLQTVDAFTLELHCRVKVVGVLNYGFAERLSVIKWFETDGVLTLKSHRSSGFS